ncbi:hypothetical protein Taro_051990 [Colocasia esculenta]|uniref:Pentatricopeptide repeat-containing protein n=1 Tax=Colocasia esculenta TaxID=4460 RepID=A0A843XII1_COLES|nr:hypothetical protein [Colocasia esculenta]
MLRAGTGRALRSPLRRASNIGNPTLAPSAAVALSRPRLTGDPAPPTASRPSRARSTQRRHPVRNPERDLCSPFPARSGPEFSPPQPSRPCFLYVLHLAFLLSAPLLRNKGGVFSALLVSPPLRRARSSNLRRGLLSVIKRHPFSSSSGTPSLQQPFSSICSDESNNSETSKEFDANAVSAICRSVISRCSHAWEKKDGAFPEVSSLLDFVKLSIGSSPQTMRRFWRVSALRPEEVLEILTGFGPKVGRKEASLLLKLFIWSGKQAGDFRHLPKSYEMMISILIGARMFRDAESLLVETSACEAFVPGFNGLFSGVIHGYVETCDLKGSIALYDRARCRPDVVLTVPCYQALLRWLVELEKADLAHRIYMDMVDMRLVSTSENLALDFIVRTLCKNGRALEAVNLLRRVRHLGIESDRASLDAIVDEYCKKRDFEDLLNFLKEWQHLPSIHLCNKILSCLCRTWGTDQAWLFMQKMDVLCVEADTKTFEIFIRWSCREGRLRNAFIYLSEMFSRMLRPNVQVYNTLLSGVFKEGMWKYAKEIYADMVETGIVPDMSTFRVILAGFCRERKFDEVTHILGEMVNRGFVCLSPSGDTFSKAFSLLGLDCLCVKVKRDNNMLFPKAEFFDSLGNGLYLDTDLPMYEGILIKILDDAVLPEFDFVVQEECRKGEMETALMMTNEAVQHGHSLSILTYSILLKGLITFDSFIDEAVNVLEEIAELYAWSHMICSFIGFVVMEELVTQKGF